MQEKVVVITGAASGIGRELAMQCAAQGAILALNDWNNEGLQILHEQLTRAKTRVLSRSYDASDRRAAASFLEDILIEFGRVDVLINNAGIALLPQLAQSAEPADIERIFQVNIWSVVHHAQLFLPHLERSKGILVNVSSIFGIIGYGYQAPYVMSKFAVRGFTETLRQEYATSKMTICCVHPGGIKTNLIHNIDDADLAARSQLAKSFDRVALTTPQQAATTILKGIRRRKRRIIVGPDAKFFDFMSRLFPSWYQRFLPKAMGPERFKPRQVKQANSEEIA